MSADGVTLTFLGTGDAFGSGGRLQTCFHVRTPDVAFLIDCGATACLAMKRAGLVHADIDAIIISHYHADHFAGLPFLIIEGRVVGRTDPLRVAGPAGIRDRTADATEVLFPGGAGDGPPAFPIEYIDFGSAAGDFIETAGIRVTTWPVTHAPATQPHALRIEVGNRIIAYSGDTEWNDYLPDVARGADVFICEVSSYGGPGGIHLDYTTLLQHRAEFDCGRFILTHMGNDVMEHADAVAAGLDATLAYDGLVVSF